MTTAIALANLCLVTISKGVADAESSGNVAVEIFDFDNYRADPAREATCDARFADLAGPLDIPCIEKPGESTLAADTARVLVVVDGGSAETYCTGEVDIAVWDFDNEQFADPPSCISASFAELAKKMGVPYEQS